MRGFVGGLGLMLSVALAGCATRAPLEIDSRQWSYGYHGPSPEVLLEAVPADLRPEGNDSTNVVLAIERAYDIDRERILRRAFDASFGAAKLTVPRGSRWVLQTGRFGLADLNYTGLMKPNMGANLSLISSDGVYLWHGREFVDITSPDLPNFTLEQLRDSPMLLANGWQAASEVLMRRLLAKYRAGIRDRREGYAN